MYRDLLAHTPLLALPIFAMFVFLTVFATAIVWTLTRRRNTYAMVAALPLENDDEQS